MDSTMTTMQQMVEDLTIDLRKNFGELHRQLVNLDKYMCNIKRVSIHGDAAITGV
jgi:hypothetical protein